MIGCLCPWMAAADQREMAIQSHLVTNYGIAGDIGGAIGVASLERQPYLAQKEA